MNSLTFREWVLAIIALLLFCFACSADAADGDPLTPAIYMLIVPLLSSFALAALMVYVATVVSGDSEPVQPIEIVPSTLEIMDIYRGLFDRTPRTLQFTNDTLDQIHDEHINKGYWIVEQGNRGGYPLLLLAKAGGEVLGVLDLGSVRVWGRLIGSLALVVWAVV